MNKKFLSAILFGALMVSSTGTFVSCKDYDDDIDNINKELTDIKSQLAALQTKVDAGKYVTNVTKQGDGIVVTWNDNSTSTIETIKGDKGDKGDKVEIAIDKETGNWIIDGHDTGICAVGKDGKPGEAGKPGEPGAPGEAGKPGDNGIDAKSPSIDPETGNWVVYTWNAETKAYDATDTGVSAKGASAYVVDMGNYYELNVAANQAGSEYTKVKLPKFASVTSMSLMEGAATLTYGTVTAANGVKFDGATYAKGTVLTNASAQLIAQINPSGIDETAIDFAIVNSKGTSPFVVAKAEAYNPKNALTRSSANGLFALTVGIKAGATEKELKAANDQALALRAASGDSYVYTAYDAKITASTTETKVSTSDASTKLNETVDLNESLTNAEVIYKCYYQLANANDAATYGITLTREGQFTATKAVAVGQDFDVKVNVMDVNGNVKEGKDALTMTVTVNKADISSNNNLADVNYTLGVATQKADADWAFTSLNNMYSAMGADAGLFKKNWNAMEIQFVDAEGKEITEVKNAADKNVAISTFIELKAGAYKFTKEGKAESVGDKYAETAETFLAFKINYEVAPVCELNAVITFKNNPSGEELRKENVKVIIKANAASLVKDPAYFSGNNASAYGTPDAANGNVTYDLLSLYKNEDKATNISFKEVLPSNKYTTWMTAGSTEITVPAYDADNAINTVYAEREFKVTYTPFGNTNIAPVTETIKLTVKSPVKEGTFVGPTAAKSIKGDAVLKVLASEFTGADVFGTKFYVGNIWNSATETVGKDTYKYNTIVGLSTVTIEAADANAEQYLKVGTAFENDAALGKENKSQYFTIALKDPTTVVATAQECQVKVTVTDVWGTSVSSIVKVTVAKNN
ncbi:collagen-like triple helix repeat-containing protein [Phocaeicola sartorii]|uniref:collagen-like triple helix repeat-containing protein n=1 Tax=Phocaeicola sartorii TaxID=671267 RepID=UPI00248C4594|nr:collagen-like protein [Phocaeicola sartorii]